MAASIYPDYPPQLSSEQSDYLLSNVKDWSILNGLAVRPAISFVPETLDPLRSLAVTAPVTLFPSLFPRACFVEARAIQTAYNELYALIARDERWLQEVVEEYAVSLDHSFSCSPIPEAIRSYKSSSFLMIRSMYCTKHPLCDSDIFYRLTEVDGFIAGLWNVHLAVKKEGYVQVHSAHQFLPLQHLCLIEASLLGYISLRLYDP